MTSAITLTNTWQEIADTGSFFATFESNGEIQVSFGASAPTGADFHRIMGGTLSAQIPEKLWARIPSPETQGVVKVDVFSDSMTVGSGIGAIFFAPKITATFF